MRSKTSIYPVFEVILRKTLEQLEALLSQYREDVPRLNHVMALKDIKNAQYYLQQAEAIILKEIEPEKVL